jgi:hypothetical protein
MKALTAAVHLPTLLLLLLVTGCTGLPPAPAGPQATPQVDDSPAGRLAGLDWLAGDWRGSSGQGIWAAHYTNPEGGVVLGTSKEFKNGAGSAATFTEFERFEVDGGKVVVWPYPQGRKSVAFTLAEYDRDNRRAAFDNPEHDFPQRLEYWRVDADTLVIKGRKLQKVNDKYPGFVITLKKL